MTGQGCLPPKAGSRAVGFEIGCVDHNGLGLAF